LNEASGLGSGSASGASAQTRAPAILTFIIADMLAFLVLFGLFMSSRTGQLALFDRSAAQLDATLGMLNTLILLTSGWQVVHAVHAARAGDAPATRRRIGLALLVGACFAVTKLLEYHEKASHGINLLTNDFFMFYFVLTGMHFLHYLIGVVLLVFLWLKAGTEAVDGPLLGWIESGGLYWHMVDLLWIVLFPMLYLIGRA
jgi:nitric oxide reductase NorE protein